MFGPSRLSQWAPLSWMAKLETLEDSDLRCSAPRRVQSAWLDQFPTNVVAVHCKGGKGRTGCFISSLIMWCSFRECKGCKMPHVWQGTFAKHY